MVGTDAVLSRVRGDFVLGEKDKIKGLMIGPLMVLSTMVAIGLLQNFRIQIPNGPPIVLVVLAIGVMNSNRIGAFIATIIAMGYAFAFFSESGHLGLFTLANRDRVIILFLLMPVQSAVIQFIKMREQKLGQILVLEQQRSLRRASRYRALFEFNPNGIFTCNAMGIIQHINRYAEKYIDAADNPLGKNWTDYLFEESQEVARNAFGATREGRPILYEAHLITGNGTPFHVEVTQLPIIMDGEVTGAFVITHDVSAKKAREDLIHHMAYHDALTDLPNRRYLTQYLEQAFCQEPRPPMGVMFIDMDHFKRINDGLGHLLGDRVLKQVAVRLNKLIGERGLLSRLGGDEFCAILPQVSLTELEEITQRIFESMDQTPIDTDDVSLRISLSIGLAWDHGNAQTPEELSQQADSAVYQAKARGRNQSVLAEDTILAHDEIITEIALFKALKENELFLEYQPIMDVKSQQIIGAEALVRWKHPTRGVLGPNAFLPIAEKFGHSDRVDQWVLREAFRQMEQWQIHHHHTGKLIGINVSTAVLTHPGFYHDLTQWIEEFHIAPESLVLEIPEHIALLEVISICDLLKQIRAIGIRLSLDDFGVGYTSLGHLKNMPLNSLKLDSQFIWGIGKSAVDESIIRHTINLAHEIGFRVVAEGVETAEQLDFLSQNACDLVQGYWLATPLDSLAVELSLYGLRAVSGH